jgi:hypothetical protein
VLEEGFRVTDGSIRFLAGLSLAALAAITGIVSYLHALTVVYITGSAGLVAYLIPFVADLMIVTASLAILDAIRHHAPKPPLAMVSLVAGIGSTLAMNIVAGLHISAGGALVAALPPVAFVLSLETLMGIVRLARAGDGANHLTATDGQCPHQVAMSAEDAVVTAYLHARDCLGEPVSQRQLSATFGVPRPKVATLVGTLNGTRPNDAEEDVTERVSLTHQQPTAGHPLSYVAVGFNRRRMLAGAAPGGGLGCLSVFLVCCRTYAPQPPGPAAPTFRPIRSCGRSDGPAASGWRGTDRAFRAVRVADHVPGADRGLSRDSAGPRWSFLRCPIQVPDAPFGCKRAAWRYLRLRGMSRSCDVHVLRVAGHRDQPLCAGPVSGVLAVLIKELL